MTNSLFQDHDVGHIMFDIVNHVKFCMVMINRCLYNVIGYVTGQHITWLHAHMKGVIRALLGYRCRHSTMLLYQYQAD